VNYLSGTADVRISGTGHDGIFYHAAYGTLDTRGYLPGHTIINSNSSNDCYVSSGTLTLDVMITNVGNVYYRGDPVNLNAVIESSGQLIKLDQ